jgi:hypothetical protein
MDLFADLKDIVKQHLKALGVQFSADAPLEKLILLALNHELKTVSQRSRKVYCSKEFLTKKSGLDAAQKQAADDILAKFRKGEDVGGHFSESSVNPKETDALLADWKIHHLHISNHKNKPTDRFYSRTGPVMFAYVSEDAAYFIDIYPHGKGFPETWTRQDLLSILDRNWPHILEPYRLKGISGVAFAPSDLELRKLRGANVNTIIQVGNSFIAPPGGGLAMDGTPSANVFRMDRTFHLIKDFERFVNKNFDQLRAEISLKSGVAENSMDFGLVLIRPSGFGVIEKKTKTLVARSE